MQILSGKQLLRLEDRKSKSTSAAIPRNPPTFAMYVNAKTRFSERRHDPIYYLCWQCDRDQSDSSPLDMLLSSQWGESESLGR